MIDTREFPKRGLSIVSSMTQVDMMPNQKTGEVPLSSVTRAKPGWYTFNYAVYIRRQKPAHGSTTGSTDFLANRFWPMKAYLSVSPPPPGENRPAQLYCSSCR